MELSNYLYPDKDQVMKELYKTDQETMEFFIPADFYGIDDGQDCELPNGEYATINLDFSELYFSVPVQFVVDNHNTYKPIWKGNKLDKWTARKVKNWRNDEWLYDDADDILYRAIEEKKLCSLSFQ